jgi:hypothetical protein
VSNIFYIRDNHYNGKIHRVKYNHDDKTVEITDHENPVNEMACREFGYEIDSACLDFEELARHSITKALTSIKVFPGSILIRIAAAWARDMAIRFDDTVGHEERFADGKPFSAVGALNLILRYLKRYIDPNLPMPVSHDEGDFDLADDIGAMIPARAIWDLEYECEKRYAKKGGTSFILILRAIQDLSMACAWYPPIGRHANRSSEVEEKVVLSVQHTMASINRWFKHLQNTEQLDEFEVMFRRAAMFNRMLREAAAITKKYQGEL